MGIQIRMRIAQQNAWANTCCPPSSTGLSVEFLYADATSLWLGKETARTTQLPGQTLIGLVQAFLFCTAYTLAHFYMIIRI